MAQTRDADLDTIRDILFGERAKSLQSALERLEAEVNARIEQMKLDVDRAQAELDAKLQEQKKSMTDNLAIARNESATQFEEIRSTLSKSLEKLRKSGTERSHLKRLLNDLATRLDDDDDRADEADRADS